MDSMHPRESIMDTEDGAESKIGIFSLPNEILTDVLQYFPAQQLIPMTLVSRRFHCLIGKVIHSRLLLAAWPKDHILILECYHPSARSTEPHLVCEYLGTPGLGDDSNHLPVDDRSVKEPTRLSDLYSYFRPLRQDLEIAIIRSHPAGGAFPERNPANRLIKDLVAHNVSLESYELFSQLCVVTHLVELGPRRGIFYNIVNIADGFVRIWRDWLKDKAESSSATLDISVDQENDIPKLICRDKKSNERILWVDSQKNTGIRVRIKERSLRGDMPVLLRHDEDPAVSYTMEYEELIIRTTHLLRSVDQALAEQKNVSGKAMIFGSFVHPSET